MPPSRQRFVVRGAAPAAARASASGSRRASSITPAQLSFELVASPPSRRRGRCAAAVAVGSLTASAASQHAASQAGSLDAWSWLPRLGKQPPPSVAASAGGIRIGVLALPQPAPPRSAQCELKQKQQQQQLQQQQQQQQQRQQQQQPDERQQQQRQLHGATGSPQPELAAPAGPLAGVLVQLAQAKLLVAGAASAVVSRTAMAPLERVKMDLLLKTSSRSALDTAKYVWQHEGLRGFYRGNLLNLLRTAPFKALNFCTFDIYSKLLAGAMPNDGGNSARFLAGAMAGITATLVCFPLDVLRTRLMAPYGHRYGGPLRTLAGMAKHEGIGALYAGCVPAVIGMAPSGAVFYGVFDLLKHRHLEALAAEAAAAGGGGGDGGSQQHPQQLPVTATLMYGAVAGAAAESIIYPLEVIRRKMQLQSVAAGTVLAAHGSAAAAAAAAGPGALLRQHGLKAVSGALAPAGTGVGAFGAAGVPGAAAVARIALACGAILRADGVAGFYTGLLPSMLQVLPSAALSYSTYETMKQLMCVA